MKHNHIQWGKLIEHLQAHGVEFCATDEAPPGLESPAPYLRRQHDGVMLTSSLPKDFDADGWINAFTAEAVCRRLGVDEEPDIRLVL